MKKREPRVVVKASELARLRKLERVVRRLLRQFDEGRDDRGRVTGAAGTPRLTHRDA